MRTWTWTSLVILLWLVAAPPAGADVISDWNEAARAIAAETGNAGPQATPRLRVQAQVALAMFEAVNAIDRRFESYLGFPAATAAASPEVAAAVAAHGVLTSVFPGYRAKLDQSLAFHLGLVPDGPARTAGVELGRAAVMRSSNASSSTRRDRCRNTGRGRPPACMCSRISRGCP